jgi:hypothetical protein
LPSFISLLRPFKRKSQEAVTALYERRVRHGYL